MSSMIQIYGPLSQKYNRLIVRQGAVPDATGCVYGQSKRQEATRIPKEKYYVGVYYWQG